MSQQKLISLISLFMCLLFGHSYGKSTLSLKNNSWPLPLDKLTSHIISGTAMRAHIHTLATVAFTCKKNNSKSKRSSAVGNLKIAF